MISSRLKQWLYGTSVSNVSKQHPGIQQNQLYGILENTGNNDNGVQLFKAIGEMRPNGSVTYNNVIYNGVYELGFPNTNFTKTNVQDLTTEELKQYQESNEVTHSLTRIQPPDGKVLRVKLMAFTRPSNPNDKIQIRVAIPAFSGGKPKPKSKKRYYSKRSHRTFRSRRKSLRSKF